MKQHEMCRAVLWFYTLHQMLLPWSESDALGQILISISNTPARWQSSLSPAKWYFSASCQKLPRRNSTLDQRLDQALDGGVVVPDLCQGTNSQGRTSSGRKQYRSAV